MGALEIWLTERDFFSTEHQTGWNLTQFGIERTVQMAFLVLNGQLKI
jgi:hypothetical protein